MYNTPTLNDTPRYRKYHNETLNGSVTSLIQPGNISMPLQLASRRDSPTVTPTRPSSVSSRRYSLSDINDTSTFYNRSRTKFDLNQSGTPSPLGNRYNANLSAYVDTRSPGYAGRMVQYNEEQERSLPTHQRKYGTPGVLPIVHLFKKKLEPLKRRSNQVTVRIASPDFSKLNSPEQNRMLLEKIVQTNSSSSSSLRSSSSSGDISTRSVLDALKEISRKRIHAHEEDYDLIEENGKRIRLDNIIEGGDCKKRQRDESSILDHSVIANSHSKKMCLLNELIASQTSMKPNLQGRDKNLKSKAVDTVSPQSKKVKQVVDVETQTAVPDVTTTATDPEPQSSLENKKIEETEKLDNKTDEKVKKKVTPILKVFDDKPLEAIRKKRLAILMGTFTESDRNVEKSSAAATIMTTTTTDIVASTDNETKSSVELESPRTPEKPLISILSGPNKTPNKNIKHVTFNLPDASDTSIITESNSVIVTSAQAIFSNIQTSATTVISSEESPKTIITSLGVITKNSDVTLSSTSTPIKSTTNVVYATPEMGTIPIQFSSNLSTPPNPISNFQFSATKPSTNLIPSSDKEKLNIFNLDSSKSESPKTEIISEKNKPIETNRFLVKPTSSSSINVENTVMSLPSGFTFTSPIVTTSNNNSMGNTSLAITTNSIELPKSLSATSSTSPPKIGGFKFDLTKPVVVTSSNTVSGFSFGTPKSKEGLDTNKTASPFSFGQKTASNPVSSSTITTTATTASGFFARSSKPFFTGVATTTTPVAVSFSTVPNLGVSNLANTTKSVPSTTSNLVLFDRIKTNVTASPSFGMATTTAAAATTFTMTSSMPSFSTVSSVAPPAFQNAVSSFGNTTSMFNFSSNTNTTTATILNFNTTTTASSMFGANTESTFVPNKNNFFGPANNTPSFAATTVTSVSTFGTQSTPSFGRPTTSATFSTSSVNSGFAIPTTTVSTFGSSTSIFGVNNAMTPSTTSTFGTAAATTTTTTTTSSMFGVPNVQVSSFNTASKPLFGGNNVSSLFGTTSVTTNTTTTPTFGLTNVFATTTASSTSFGATSSKFGVATTPSITFGNNSAPTFAASNTFGGNTVSGFGTSSGFGTNTNNNNNTPPASFGTPTTAAVGFQASGTGNFGSNSNNFGSNTNFVSNSPFQSSTTAPTFGSASPAVNFSTAPTNNVFGSSSFGSNSSGFGFSKLQPNANSFGSASTTFGSSPSVFGGGQQNNSFQSNPVNTQSGVFTFGSSNAKPPGVFSFGSNEPPKSTFNFTGSSNPSSTFGGANPPAFGANPNPAFGAVAPASFNSQPNGPGMFSIGSGSTPSRTRTLKIKRRT